MQRWSGKRLLHVRAVACAAWTLQRVRAEDSSRPECGQLPRLSVEGNREAAEEEAGAAGRRALTFEDVLKCAKLWWASSSVPQAPRISQSPLHPGLKLVRLHKIVAGPMEGLGRCSAMMMSGLAWWGFVLLLARYFSGGVLGYQNYSVGDDHGWSFPSSNVVVDYQKWATGKNFSLGDFLLFSYPQEEHDIVVTYNATVFKTCDFLDGNDGDYEVWGEAGKSTFSAIPLVRTGMNYFFCGAEGGDHCKGGMKFAINVTEGEGLPAILMVPPAAPTDEGGGGNGGSGGGDGGNGGGNGGVDGGGGSSGGSSYNSPSGVPPYSTPVLGLFIAFVIVNMVISP